MHLLIRQGRSFFKLVYCLQVHQTHMPTTPVCGVYPIYGDSYLTPHTTPTSPHTTLIPLTLPPPHIPLPSPHISHPPLTYYSPLYTQLLSPSPSHLSTHHFHPPLTSSLPTPHPPIYLSFFLPFFLSSFIPSFHPSIPSTTHSFHPPTHPPTHKPAHQLLILMKTGMEGLSPVPLMVEVGSQSGVPDCD